MGVRKNGYSRVSAHKKLRIHFDIIKFNKLKSKMVQICLHIVLRTINFKFRKHLSSVTGLGATSRASTNLPGDDTLSLIVFLAFRRSPGATIGDRASQAFRQRCGGSFIPNFHVGLQVEWVGGWVGWKRRQKSIERRTKEERAPRCSIGILANYLNSSICRVIIERRIVLCAKRVQLQRSTGKLSC